MLTERERDTGEDRARKIGRGRQIRRDREKARGDWG